MREASLAVARRPDTELGHALEEGRELTGPLITELATAGDPVARGAIETIGRALGVGLVNLVNTFNPQVIVIGGGVIAAGELLLAPAREVMLERALAPAKDVVRVEAARHGPEAGMIGAALLARDVADGVVTGAIEARPVSGRLVVCPTPIGNLEDITLRVLDALRNADVVACEDTRHTRVLLERYGVSASLVSYHEHNERARAAELVERMRDGAVVALVSDAGMPLVSDPGYALVQGCVAAGLAVEVLPGPSSAITALVASALPSDAWRFAGFLPRKRAGLEAVFAVAGDRRRVRVPAPRRRVAGRARRARPGAPGRGLPRAHEAPRGGRPRHRRPSSRPATRPSRRRARSCSSSALPRSAPAPTRRPSKPSAN